jgi:hypothetical protein
MISGIILLLLLLGLFAAVFWSSRPRGDRDRSYSGVPGSTAPLPIEAQEYLSQLDGALGLPADIRADIRAELADHLQDSIAAIEAEGLDQDRAVREALARLGRPAELARQMRHAHQTTRRLLAGAAGGIFQAGLGVVYGYIWSLVLFVLVAFIATVLSSSLRPFLDYVAQRLPEWSPEFGPLYTAAIPLALMSLLPAFFAGRWSVRALMRGSRRPTAQIARWWALGGTLAIAWYVLFGMTAEQGWLAVPLELLIPIVFAVGALWRTHKTLFQPRWRVPLTLVAGTLVLVLVAGVAGVSTSVSGPDGPTSYEKPGSAYDRLGPEWQGDLGLNGFSGTYSSWSTRYAPVIEAGWDVSDPSALASFKDLRFEAWRATQFQDAPSWLEDFIPAPGYTAPFATQPAVGVVYATVETASSTTDYTSTPPRTVEEASSTTNYTAFTARFDMSHTRSNRWLVVMTGVAPDGIRYRLAMETSRTSFSGTIWDWLTAGE